MENALHIVVADDDRDCVLSLTLLLQTEGHVVRGVYHGADVLNAVCDFGADVVLLDIGMPQLSGYDVARKLRERYGRAAPMLVAVTGWKKPSDKILAQIAGFDHHLAKPYDPHALLALLPQPVCGR